MSNPISPLSQFNLPTINIAQTSSAAGPVTDLSSFSKSFNEILSAAMLSSVQPSTSGSSSNTGSILLPMMLTLLERMLSQNLAGDNNGSGIGIATLPGDSPIYMDSSGLLAGGAGSTPSGRPVGGVLTNTFHAGHNGLDFGVPVGTEVQATMSGKVVYAGWNNEGYGNLVIVENGPYRTYFAHLSQIPVKIGQVVQSGNVVGISGNTGNSTGPHLHYEVRNNQKVIDPTSFTLSKTG